MTLVYVDTNIFMDFLEGRNKKAFTFFMRAISCEFTILISDIVLFELKKQGFDFSALCSWLDKKLSITACTSEDKKFGRTLPTHYADGLHAAIAQRHKADVFLSGDKGFSFLKNHVTLDDI